MNEEGWSFKCKDCGSIEIYVEHEYSITEELVDSLECTCDEKHDFAAQRTRHITRRYLDTMLLDDDHRTGDVEESTEIDREEEEDSFEIECHNCFENAREQDWTTEVESSDIDEDIDEDSVEFYVRCDGCNREIEFGWSHPERGGRIWPAECSDFNPWKSWPEPRYRDKWLERGWIRPNLR